MLPNKRQIAPYTSTWVWNGARYIKKKFEDATGVIRNRKSQKDMQYNYQKKKKKRTNKDLQNISQKTKDRATRTQLKKTCWRQSVFLRISNLQYHGKNVILRKHDACMSKSLCSFIWYKDRRKTHSNSRAWQRLTTVYFLALLKNVRNIKLAPIRNISAILKLSVAWFCYCLFDVTMETTTMVVNNCLLLLQKRCLCYVRYMQ